MITLLTEIVKKGASVEDGVIISAVCDPWFKIIELISRDPAEAHRIPHRKWEEIIAAAYAAAGFDEVILTPGSGDLGRDVIAVKSGFFSIRVYDQVKAYKPGHLVTAEEVRALNGTIDWTVTKGIVTTTSDFAPNLAVDRILAPLIPHRIELRNGEKLREWMQQVAKHR